MYLEQVNVVDGQSSLLQSHWNRITWANTHNPWCQARHARCHIFSQNSQTQLLGLFPSHEQYSCSTVGNLARVTTCCFSIAPLGESASDLGQGCGSTIVPDSVIFIDNDASASARLWVFGKAFYGNDFGEAPFTLGSRGALV